MSAELFVQPSQFVPGSGAQAGQWFRGIPRAGIGAFLPGYTATGRATCANLIADSPPTLLESYEIYSYAIGWGIYIAQGGAYATPPVFTAELAFLVNDRVRYVTSQNVESVTPGFALEATASGSWIADLTNPLVIGPRDRLALRMGILSDQDGLANCVGIVGMQLAAQPAGAPRLSAFESTISYRTMTEPGARRL